MPPRQIHFVVKIRFALPPPTLLSAATPQSAAACFRTSARQMAHPSSEDIQNDFKNWASMIKEKGHVSVSFSGHFARGETRGSN
jgi:hypothetical protein